MAIEYSQTGGAPDDGQSATSAAPLPPRPPYAVVGLGASAGGLEALQTFLDHTPPDTGMAFVVILHLSPEHDSQAAAVLQHHTAMPVTQVTATVPLMPNHVYVIPPAKRLLMADGQLRLEEPASEQDRRAPIDYFFRTLADGHSSHATAVILSGTGSDGAEGLKRVKEHGGTVLVQDPQEAGWDGMPRNAIATGMVDYVLPVATMPDMLQAYWRRASRVGLPVEEGDGETAALPEDGEAVLREVLAVLRVRTNHDFHQYKRPTLLRRIARRMYITGVPDMPAYLELLRSRPEEIHALLQDLLISVTNFFRDQEAWTALEAIIPLLFQGKGPGDQLRVWVTACATGEEAYTVAMLLEEYARTLDHPPAIQVFATDINENAVRRARQGVYLDTIAADVTPARLQQFFVLDGARYRVTQILRDRVLFAHHNVLRDPPFSRLDLITCRNLLIYFNREAQEQALRLFHFSLRPRGYLLLGNSESVDAAPGLFDVVTKGQRLFNPHSNPALLPPPMPSVHTTRHLEPRASARPRPAVDQDSLQELHQRLILAQAPASLVVNADDDIMHLSAGAGRFLLQDAGAPSINLLQAAHPDLRLPLQTALLQAAQLGRRSGSRRVRVRFGNVVRLVDVVAQPVQDPAWPEGYRFVSLDDQGEASEDGARAEPGADAHVQELQSELQRTGEQLRITVEAYETAGEEYKAGNEELTAINEELRAATEELEAGKEELQAVNEELQAVNQELKHKVDETTHANNDLQNLIAATQIGTLFLDREVRITRYTPSVQAIFNLLPTDLQRPLSHITHSLDDVHLAEDAQAVLATLQSIEREVASTAGRWYLVHLRPYRTLDDHIGGVVITFVDITERKRAEEALRTSEEKYRALFEKMNQGFGVAQIILDDAGRPVDYRMVEINPQFERLTGQRRETFLQGRTVREVAPELVEEWYQFYGEVGITGRPAQREIHSADWNRWFEVMAYRIGDPAERRVAILYDEITERKRAEEALRESEERKSFLLHLTDAIRSEAGVVAIQETVTRTALTYFRADRCYYCEIEGDTAIIRRDASRDDLPSVVGEYPLSSLPIHKAVSQTGQPIVVPDVTTTKLIDEELKQLCLQMQIIAFINVPVMKDGHAVGNLCITQGTPRAWTRLDVELAGEIAERTWAEVERARAAAALRESEAQFRTVTDAVPQLIWTNDADGKAVYFNRRWFEYSGLSLDESLGPGWQAIVHPDDAPESIERWQQALAAEVVFDTEYRLRRADGLYRWHLGRNVPLHDEGGELVAWFGSATDIQEERLAREAALAAQAEAEAALKTRA